VLKVWLSDRAGAIRKLGNPTRETAENNNIVMQTAGSYILTLQLQGK